MKVRGFNPHAVKRFRERSERLGLDGSEEKLSDLLSGAIVERRPRSRGTRMHLFKRGVIHGQAKRFVAAGWRFLVLNGWLIGAERVKPHENYCQEEIGYG